MEKSLFCWDNVLFASKAKINVLKKILSGGPPKGIRSEEIFLEKYLIALLTSKTKSNVFWKKKFLHSRSFSATIYSKNFLKILILAFEANSALSCKNGLFSELELIVCYVHYLCDRSQFTKHCSNKIIYGFGAHCSKFKKKYYLISL